MKLTTLLIAFALCLLQAAPQKPGQLVQQWSASPKYNFIENKGQIIDQNNQPNPDVKYLFPGNGLHVQRPDRLCSNEALRRSMGITNINNLNTAI